MMLLHSPASRSSMFPFLAFISQIPASSIIDTMGVFSEHEHLFSSMPAILFWS